MEYVRHLFQDAIETNWVTAWHSSFYRILNRTNVFGGDLYTVEKVRIQNTARVIQTESMGTHHKLIRMHLRRKLNFNANNYKLHDHTVDGVIGKHACSCFHARGWKDIPSQNSGLL